MTLVCCGPDSGGRRIALTFDDGPSEWTAPILDALEAAGGHATFFVVGRYAERRPELLERMHAAGHEIGNHTYDHVDAAHERDDGVLRDQLVRAGAAIEAAVPAPPQLVRPPYGKDVCRVGRIGAGLGLATTVLWSVQAWDWDEETTADWIVERVLSEIRPGAIVLLHDGAPPYDASSRQATVEAVRVLVPELAARGFELATVSRLLRP